jgi:hypothetical protein
MNHSQQLLFSSVFFLSACSTTSTFNPSSIETNKSSQFQKVWNQVQSDPVDQLPQERVSFRKLVQKGKNIILGNAQRTLENHADILPQFNKLAHPNGICFKGTWEITAENNYSGYFKKNSKALIIVRASSAMSNTKQGQIRSFGFAGKIFPTLNPLQVNDENTANFFLIDDLGGTKATLYTDVELTNAPKASITSVVLKSLLYVSKLARTFSKADENPKIRQLYEISTLGESNNPNIITPQWMMLHAQEKHNTAAKDFREELEIKDKVLNFDISVASQLTNDKKKWQKIGTIALDTSVVSNSCDHRLHFHHPKWRNDLKH